MNRLSMNRLRLIGAISFLVGSFLTLVATFWFGMIYQKGELSGLNILWPIASISPLIAAVFIYFKNGLWKEHTVGTGTSKKDIDRLVEERVEKTSTAETFQIEEATLALEKCRSR